MAFSADFVLIRSYSARSDLKNKSARFSGKLVTIFHIETILQKLWLGHYHDNIMAAGSLT